MANFRYTLVVKDSENVYLNEDFKGRSIEIENRLFQDFNFFVCEICNKWGCNDMYVPCIGCFRKFCYKCSAIDDIFCSKCRPYEHWDHEDPEELEPNPMVCADCPYLNDLPVLIIDELLEYLDDMDKTNLAMTSKHFYWAIVCPCDRCLNKGFMCLKKDSFECDHYPCYGKSIDFERVCFIDDVQMFSWIDTYCFECLKNSPLDIKISFCAKCDQIRMGNCRVCNERKINRRRCKISSKKSNRRRRSKN